MHFLSKLEPEIISCLWIKLMIQNGMLNCASRKYQSFQSKIDMSYQQFRVTNENTPLNINARKSLSTHTEQHRSFQKRRQNLTSRNFGPTCLPTRNDVMTHKSCWKICASKSEKITFRFFSQSILVTTRSILLRSDVRQHNTQKSTNHCPAVNWWWTSHWI